MHMTYMCVQARGELVVGTAALATRVEPGFRIQNGRKQFSIQNRIGMRFGQSPSTAEALNMVKGIAVTKTGQALWAGQKVSEAGSELSEMSSCRLKSYRATKKVNARGITRTQPSARLFLTGIQVGEFSEPLLSCVVLPTRP